MARDAVDGFGEDVRRALRARQTGVIETNMLRDLDTVPHAESLKSLANHLSDRWLLRLLKVRGPDSCSVVRTRSNATVALV